MQLYANLQPQPSLSEVCRQMRLHPARQSHNDTTQHHPTPVEAHPHTSRDAVYGSNGPAKATV